MCKHFLLYWKPKTVDYHLGKILYYTTSQQLRRCNIGDTLWIVSVRKGNLFLVSKLLINKITDQNEIKKIFNTPCLFEANYYAINIDNTEIVQEINLKEITENLRFESKYNDRFILKNGLVDAKQLQQIRSLTPESIVLLENQWNFFTFGKV